MTGNAALPAIALFALAAAGPVSAQLLGAGQAPPAQTSEMADNVNILAGIYPDGGGLLEFGPLGNSERYGSFIGGLGASAQVARGWGGAELDFGYSTISRNSRLCAGVACGPDLAITQPALLADLILNPYASVGPYVYAMGGAGYNTLTATDASGYGSRNSFGPIFGVGVMVVRPRPARLFGDFELRYTDYGHFGIAGTTSLTALTFLLKIGLRWAIPAVSG